MFPIPGFLSNRMRIYQANMMAKMDARVQIVSESTIPVLPTIMPLADDFARLSSPQLLESLE